MHGRSVLDYVKRLERAAGSGRFTDPVEVAPFAAWIRQQQASGITRTMMGFVSEYDTRTITAFLCGERVLCERARVEDWLEQNNKMFWEVYPEDGDDEPLEPDAYCVRCDDIVTPINRRCPWH
ncbi:MAG: hypothetical protein H0U53_02245, partial [Actinobacteria bacterium]|nr:hypothetical protein [Actinomycetota bacterium]